MLIYPSLPRQGRITRPPPSSTYKAITIRRTTKPSPSDALRSRRHPTYYEAVAVRRTTKPSPSDALRSRRHQTHHKAVAIQRITKLSPSDTPQSCRHQTHYKAVAKTHYEAVAIRGTTKPSPSDALQSRRHRRTPHTTHASAANNNIAARHRCLCRIQRRMPQPPLPLQTTKTPHATAASAA